jgi:CDP-4-dehydro-6-deoxyglucose reductase
VPTVQFLSGGKPCSVSVQGKTSLLEHALAAALPVSYSCRRGDCGQCIATLLAGELEPMDAGRPLVGDGGVFLCNAVAVGDVVVELPHLAELEGLRVIRSPSKIHELGRLSDDVLQVTLRLPPSVRFEYRPGQYLRLARQSQLTRSYSLAEPPAGDKLLRIHVRRVDGGAFSQYLFESAKVGDLLHLEGPLGRFILRDGVSVKKSVFLATGTGIAPIHALLASLARGQARGCGELFLYWGNRQTADAYFQAPLQELARSAGVSYFELFSPQHVQDVMAGHHPDLSDAQVFASGNPAMITDARTLAAQLGLPGDLFFADPFTAS